MTGGIVAFQAQDSISIGATISIAEGGFQGGAVQPDFDCFGIFGFPGFDGIRLTMGRKRRGSVAMLGLNMDVEEMAVVAEVVVMIIIAVAVVAVTPVKEAKVDCLLDSFAVLVSVVSVGILFRPTKAIDSLWAAEVVLLTWVMVMGLGMVIMLVMVGAL